MSKAGGAHAEALENGLPVEVARLPQKLMRSFREAFSKFDPANDDVVPSSELPAMLHSLSLNPTERELKSAADDLLRGQSRLTFVVFCRASKFLPPRKAGACRVTARWPARGAEHHAQRQPRLPAAAVPLQPPAAFLTPAAPILPSPLTRRRAQKSRRGSTPPRKRPRP